MSKRQLNVQESESGDITILTLQGAVDASNVEDFRAALDRARHGAHKAVLIECSELTYVNSACFGLFFKYHRDMKRDGGALAICSLRGKITNIIKLLGLDKFLDIYTDKDGAMNDLVAALQS